MHLTSNRNAETGLRRQHGFMVSRKALAIGLTLLSLAVPAWAQGEVKTIAGGRLSPNGSDAGFRDGDTIQAAQFNRPFGAAVDRNGFIFVADSNNGALRKIDTARNRTSTLLSDLNQPVAVAVDGTNNLYIVTHGDGAVWKLDRFENQTRVAANLLKPTAVAVGPDQTLYITEEGGRLISTVAGTFQNRVITSTLSNPQGVAFLDSGLVAVSECGKHRIVLLQPGNGGIVSIIGGGPSSGAGTSGFRDGSSANALFNQPHHLAKAPGGNLVVADRGNHRVRLINFEGFVTTLYGISADQWEGPECPTCNPAILPGWYDASTEFAEAREPVGVAVTPDGQKVYATELYYHLVREFTPEGSLGGGGGNNPGTNVVVLPPTITPESGYFPLGQVIRVFNPNSSPFLSSAVYYTMDGTDPTTNSPRVEMESGEGSILFTEKLRDLRSLRLKTFIGSQSSPTVSGKAPTQNQIGVTRDLTAGPGSSLVVPVVVTLRTNLPLRSLQFRIEVTPESGNAPMISDAFTPLSLSTNDLIPVATSNRSGESNYFLSYPYTNGPARGRVITYISTNSNLQVEDFATVAMMSVPIPPSAPLGATYTIRVLNPSGTSDGFEQQVPLFALPDRRITVASARYLVGDTAPSRWYNADQPPFGFGDGDLNNADANNVFNASLGVRTPFPFTDLFDAMDSFPLDSTERAGGDGIIRFLDWQTTILRSIGLDPSRWERFWTEGGIRMAEPVGAFSPGLGNLAAQEIQSTPEGAVWFRHVLIEAIPPENVAPGAAVDVPVYVNVTSGCELAGMAFRATIEPVGWSLMLEQQASFVPAAGVPAPIFAQSPALNTVLCGWPLVPSPSFNPAITGRKLIGYVRFRVPVNAMTLHAYTLRFSYPDGAPNLQTQYDFETRPATVWINAPAPLPPEVITDEWRVHFFGSLTNSLAAADADPDRDGISNLNEFLAGTHPNNASSSLQLQRPAYDPVNQSVVLRWLSAPGKTYVLEVSPNILGGPWSTVAADLKGDGRGLEWRHKSSPEKTQFYRLRVQ